MFFPANSWTDERTDGRTDGRTAPYHNTIPSKDGRIKKEFICLLQQYFTICIWVKIKAHCCLMTPYCRWRRFSLINSTDISYMKLNLIYLENWRSKFNQLKIIWNTRQVWELLFCSDTLTGIKFSFHAGMVISDYQGIENLQSCQTILLEQNTILLYLTATEMRFVTLLYTK